MKNDQWQEVKLDNIATIIMGHSPSSLAYNNNRKGLPLIQGNNDIQNSKTITRLWTSEITKIADKNDIVFTVRAPVGNIAISHTRVCIGRGVCSIKSNHQKFLCYFLNKIKDQWKKLEQGSTFTAINSSDIKSLKIKLPNIIEQKRIVAVLETWDKVIEKMEKKIEIKKNIKKGLMQKIFSQEIRFKDENGKSYPDWKEEKLGKIGKFISGIGFPETEQGNKKGVPFFKVSDMNLKSNNRYMLKANNYVTSKQISRLKFKPIKNKSIIFAKVGAAIFLERKRIANDFLIDNNMMAYSPKKNIDFIKYMFDNIKLSHFVHISALPSYNASDLSSIRVKLPSQKEEQKKIADLLSTADKEIELLESKLNKINDQKKYLLDNLITGKIRTPKSLDSEISSG